MFDITLAQRSDVIGTRDLETLISQRVEDMIVGLSRDVQANLVVNMLERSRIDAALYDLTPGVKQLMQTVIECAINAGAEVEVVA